MKKSLSTFSVIAAAAMFFGGVEGAAVTLGFDDVFSQSGGITTVEAPYVRSGFVVQTNISAGLVTIGSGNMNWPGSPALLIGDGHTLTVTQQNSQPFNFTAASFAERQANSPTTVTLLGTKVGGGTVTVTINLDGGPVSLQSFSFSTLTNLSSLQITGRSQWDSGTFETTPGTVSSLSANFDNAVIGTVGNSYATNGLNFTSATTMTISTVMGSRALSVGPDGAITMTTSIAGQAFTLSSFDLSSPGFAGVYSLVASYQDGSTFTSEGINGGFFSGTDVNTLMGNRTTGITSLRFQGFGDEFSDPLALNSVSVQAAVFPPEIQSRVLPNGDFEIAFTGVLQSSPNMGPGTWQDVTPAPTSPLVIPKAGLGARGFFRARSY